MDSAGRFAVVGSTVPYRIHLPVEFPVTTLHGPVSRPGVAPRRAPTGAGGAMPSDDELLERTLAFSGSYVSDDGTVTIRRLNGPAFEYSGHRFLGHCTVCARASLIPAAGEQLADVRAVLLFLAAHEHGDED